MRFFTLGRLAALSALLGFLVLGAIGLLSVFSGTAVLDTSHDTARIRLSADHRLVLSPSTCIQVSWQVDGIREVYLNGQGVVGSGQQPLCIDQTAQPALRVVFADGSERIYTLDIPILLAFPAVWALTVTGMSLLLLALYLAALHLIRLGHRTKRAIQGTFGVVLSVALALVILEVGLRFYYSTYGTPQDHMLYTDPPSEILATLIPQQQMVAVPYLNFNLNPNYQSHNQLGYRGTEVTIPKPQGIYRIVVMGDSLTYGQTLTPEQAYPGQLQEVLRDDYGYANVEVINAGVVNYTSWEELVDLSFRIVDLSPDLVIVYGVSNDVRARTVTPDCYAGISPRRGLDPLRQLALPSVTIPNASTLLRFWEINVERASPPQFYFAPYQDGLCQPSGGGSEAEHLAQNPPIYFIRNLHSMVAVARMNGIKMLLVTQAYNQKAPLDVLPDWWMPAVDDHNRIVLGVARELGVGGFDLMAAIDQNPDYWFGDGFHPTITGAHEYGRLLASYIVGTGWLGAAPHTG